MTIRFRAAMLLTPLLLIQPDMTMTTALADTAAAPAAALQPSNPLAAETSLPFAAPPFDRLRDSDFGPAIVAGMAEEDQQIRKIAEAPSPPTFDNTIAAMERSGQLLTRANALFQHLIQANSSDALQKLSVTMAPRLQAHTDNILLNPKLFGRVQTLYATRDTLGLDDKQKFLLSRVYTRFVRAGAKLSDADKAKLRAINGQVATLQAQYQNILIAASDAASVIVSDKAELDGLSDGQIAVAAEAAKARKLDVKYLLAIQNTTQQPLLADLKNRALRERVLAASESRGDKPGPTDLRDIIATLAKLRAERAKLLGYDSHAAYVLADQMAKTPDAAEKLLKDVAAAGVAKAKTEAAEIQAVIDKQKGGFALTAADWQFYADQVRKAKYDIDENAEKQYFELARVLKDGVFFAANKLYGITVKTRTDIPIYQPDVKVFEIFDADGKSLALFYADYFARPNKAGGAWCNYLNQPSGLMKRQPVIVNVANFTKPAPGEPALLTFDDVTTMFHEFGHALHFMFSVNYYPTENGTNLPTDVIEFPSQFNEHWALDDTVLASYAKHYKTGEPIPAALVGEIKAARTYGQGYATTEAVAAAMLDLDWHSLPATAAKQVPDIFEAASLKKNGVDLPQVPPRYRSPYFLHIWANGYDANYYSYMWGEILDDDAFEWFTAHGGLSRENGQRFRDLMLAPGNVANPMDQYRAFRGRDPSVDALKRQRGLE